MLEWLIYMGGVYLAAEDEGFWASVIWPWYLGKRLYLWSKE